MDIRIPLADAIVMLIILPVIGAMAMSFIWLSVNEKVERENILENRPKPDSEKD
jgi:hypothetical protein